MQRWIILALMFLLASVAVVADEDNNNPFTNDEANACNDGGTLEDRCNVDFDRNGSVDDYEVEWAWQCGWYLIRVEAGIFSSDALPEGCNDLAPEIFECYTVVDEFVIDELEEFEEISISVAYFGPPNQVGNMAVYENGTCAEPGYSFFEIEDGEVEVSISFAMVIADIELEAQETCYDLGGLGALPLYYLGFNTPMNYWGCLIVSGFTFPFPITADTMMQTMATGSR